MSPPQLPAGVALTAVLPAYAAGRQGLVDNGSPLTGAIADPAAWLAGHGWTGGTVDVPGLVAGLGCRLPTCLDPTAPDGELFAFVTATPSAAQT